MFALLKADVSRDAWVTLGALHVFADKKGRVFKSQQELAEVAGIHATNLSKALKELRSHGFVITVKQKGAFHRIDPILIRYSSIDSDIQVSSL